MWVWLVPLALLVVSGFTAGFLALRKVPHLRVMETDSAAGARSRQVKEALILDRFARLRHEKLGRLGRLVADAGAGVVRLGRQAVQRLYRQEQYYQRLKRAPAHDASPMGPGAVRPMLDEAAAFLRAKEPIQAEKKYIEAISLSPKCAEAYEGLGNLYLEVKQLAQAREALAFALRLSPSDASVHMSLADVDLAEGKVQAALAHLRESVEKRPNNPKYLDRYVETALAAKERKDAERGIGRLKEANPENQKIPEFEQRLEALPEGEASG